MMQKIIGWMLAVAMFFGTTAASAAEVTEKPPFTNTLKVGHLPGDTHKVVTKDDIIATDGAEVSGNGVQINAGGSATFGFSSRFAMRSVTLRFEGASGTTTIDTGDNLYTITDLAGDGEYVLVFGENLGYEPQPYAYASQLSGYYREYVELKGEKEIKVSTTGGMLLKEMAFEKDKTPILEKAMGVPKITSTEKALMTTIALDEMSTAILVNGAIRYLDNNDITTRPYEENGTLYIPINTLAKALGYYVEDYPEKQYALLRSDTHEYVMLEGKHIISTGLAEPVQAPFEAIIYREGKTLAAVRYFAELIGETVLYDNGFIIIEDRYTANKFMADESMRMYIEDILSPFKEEKEAGKTYYVAQNGGSDSNPGTSLAPFRTIGKAAEIATAGDTVIVRGGTYREILKPANSGTENAPITFKAADDEKVVISALEEFDTWAKAEGDEYMTKMSWDLGKTRNQLFIDGEALTEARHPNSPGILAGESIDLNKNVYPVRGDLYRIGGDENRNLVRSATQLWQEENYWKGGVFVGLFGNAYQVQSAVIESSSPGELVVGPEKSTFWYDPAKNDYFNWGYIAGHRNALDAPGEWFREETGLLYLIFPEGKTPQNSKVEAKARQLVIDLNDRDFINIEGFETIGGSARMNNSTMCMLNGVDMKYISHSILTADHFSGYLDFNYTAGLSKKGDYEPDKMDKNGAPERGEVGVYIGGRNNIFVNSSIKYSGYAGLYMTGLYTYVENNEIADAGYSGSVFGGLLVINRAYDDVSVAKGGHFISNNTVYNTGGRHMYISRLGVNKHTPYLPIEVGYNDFHDAMMMSTDTGIIYHYDINGGYDGIMSTEHHNYVYMTINYKDFNPHSNGIYHDGTSFGVDAFKNQVFWTQRGGGLSGVYVQEQYLPIAPANFLQWDNYRTGLVRGGSEALDEGYFAEDKPYYAGCLKGVDYTKNYDRFKAGEYGMKLSVANAELSEGVTVDDTGYAHFTEAGQYVKFNDVDFGEKGNCLVFSARGNYTHTNDVVDVIIGDSLENGYRYEMTINNLAPEKDIPSRFELVLNNMSGGVHDVYIRVKEYYSLELGGLSVYERDSDPDGSYSCYFYPGDYQEVAKFDEAALGVHPVPKSPRNVDPRLSVLNATTPGWYTKYENLEFTTDSDAFVYAIGSAGTYANQPVEIYVDGLAEENMVCRFYDKGVSWNDRVTYRVELSKTVPAGRHDVYIKFASDKGYNLSSVLKVTAFLKAGVIPEELDEPPVKVFGGQFDAEISTQNKEYPFYGEFMDPPNYYAKGLTYTLPGTVAGYKAIEIPFDAKEFVISYSAEMGIDGQPVEIRLGSPDSEPIASFVTEGNGLMKFNKLKIELDEIIPAGVHDIYISFGGDESAKLNTKLNWFGFNY